MILRARLCCAFVLVAFLGGSPAWALSAFNNLVVFGDSLVDAGNTQNLVVGALGAAFDPAPASAGYYEGRFSNGPVASDVLYDAILGGDSTASSEGGSNYAYGGARARNNDSEETLPVPDLALQVGEYLINAGAPDPNTLYFINAGGNDVRDILVSADPFAAAPVITGAAVTEILTQINMLSVLGARNFLVAGVGNVGGIPETIGFGQAAQDAGRAVSEAFNAALFGALPAGVATLDTIALFDAVLPNPAAFGLPAGINITDACLLAGAAPPSGAPTCDDFAFFDTIHPTTQVAAVFGDGLIAAVPEPGTAALISLGLVCMATRRRARR